MISQRFHKVPFTACGSCGPEKGDAILFASVGMAGVYTNAGVYTPASTISPLRGLGSVITPADYRSLHPGLYDIAAPRLG